MPADSHPNTGADRADRADLILILTADVARLLSVSTKTVTRLVRDDPTFPKPVKLGVAVRHHRTAVEAWAAARAGLPTPSLTDAKLTAA